MIYVFKKNVIFFLNAIIDNIIKYKNKLWRDVLKIRKKIIFLFFVD